jgi:hypothetical protein
MGSNGLLEIPLVQKAGRTVAGTVVERRLPSEQSNHEQDAARGDPEHNLAARDDGLRMGGHLSRK